MAKIFDRQFEDIPLKYRPTERMDERLWFKVNQPLLLWLTKHPQGYKLLCLNQTNIGEIHEIAPNYVRNNKYVNGQRISTTDFRIGKKWANLVRFQWEWFCDLAQEYYFLMSLRKLPFLAYRVPSYFEVGTTSTFYPDPDPESTTVDGYVARSATNEAWATIRGGAGTGSGAADAAVQVAQYVSGTSSNTFDTLLRSIFLFNTASIGDTDTIDSAVLSLRGTAKSDGNTGTPSIDIYTSTPASNTAIANGDFSNTGTTSQTGAPITYANWSTTAYNDFTLDATGRGNVSKTGVSKFAAKFVKDSDNVAPAWVSGQQSDMSARYADFTGTTDDPKLVVTHTTPVTFVPKIIII